MKWWIYFYAEDGLYRLAQGRRTQIAAWRIAQAHRFAHHKTNSRYFVASDPALRDDDPDMRELANDNLRY